MGLMDLDLWQGMFLGGVGMVLLAGMGLVTERVKR